MNNIKSHIRFGLLGGAALGIIFLIVMATNTKMAPSFQIGLTAGIIVLAIFAALQSFSKTQNSTTFKDLFVTGFKTTAVISLIVIAFGLITLQLFPGIKKETLSTWEKEAIAAIHSDSAAKFEKLKSLQFDATMLIKKIDSLTTETKEIRTAFAKNKALYINKFNTIFVGQNLLSCMLIGIMASVFAAFAINRKK